MKKLALFASGNGTNVQQITEYFTGHPCGITVDCVVYNRKEAFVATRAKNLGLPAFYMNKADFYSGDKVLNLLKEREVDYIVLAGFLLLVPQNLLEAYPGRIINIHPALLPKYGGLGMYGHHVHEAVIAHHETESGITIHLVDPQFDHGKTLFQAKCQLSPEDTPDTLAAMIHLLEKEHFPKVIEQFVNGKL